jgi:uncharacterized protein YraI
MKRSYAILTVALTITLSGLAFGAGQSATVTASRLNLRQGPSTKAPILGSLKKGQDLRIVKRQAGWVQVIAKIKGKLVKGWVSNKYIEMKEQKKAGEAKPAEAPKAFTGSLKTHKDKLTFIHDSQRSAIDLIGLSASKYRQFSWDKNDYPGSPKGPNEKLARALATELKKLVPERRVNTGPFKLPFQWSQIEAKLVPVRNQPRYKLYKTAAQSFEKMRLAALKDKVVLKIVSASRTPAHQKRLSGKNKNGAAVARGVSTHNYGLAIDLAMSPGAKAPLKEVSTRPFSNVMAMRCSPVHKWLVFFGKDFGWYPYTNEPWHWEYNPRFLKKTFP